jgi:SAM-dependent methyltransferase
MSIRVWTSARPIPIWSESAEKLLETGDMPPLPTTARAPEDTLADRLAGPDPSLAGSIDTAAIAAVTDLYRQILPPGGAILDVMSSWVSHLPPEIPFSRVVGIGINPRELAENPFLDEWRVQDLNREPQLPFATGEFDGATMCVAVQHLTRPGEVIRELGRVLRPGAPLVVTFSSCCLSTPAIAGWRLLDDADHLCLIAQHFAAARNWTGIRCLDRTPAGGREPLYAVIGRSLGPAPPAGDD